MLIIKEATYISKLIYKTDYLHCGNNEVSVCVCVLEQSARIKNFTITIYGCLNE